MQQGNNLLDESNKFLLKIKNETKIRELKKAKRNYVILYTKKWAVRIAVTAFVILSLFYPVETGTVIGNWLHDFVGTIYKNITK